MNNEEDVLAFLRGEASAPSEGKTGGRGILVFLGVEPGAKPSKAALEVLGKSQMLKVELGCHVQALCFVSETQRDREVWTRYGIDTLYVAPRLAQYSAQAYEAKLLEIVKELNPEIFLFPDETASYDLAPRLAQRLETICATGVRAVDLNLEEHLLEFYVETYGGRLAEVWLTSKGKVQIAVFKKGCFSEAQKDPEFLGKVVVRA